MIAADTLIEPLNIYWVIGLVAVFLFIALLVHYKKI